jgi:hypothetical protein
MADEIETAVRRAYMPYVRAFLEDPGTARLKFGNTPTAVLATLEMSQRDYDRFDDEVTLRAEQKRTFNNIVRELEDTRRPSLRFRVRE